MMSREEYKRTQEQFKKLLEPFTKKENEALANLPKVLAVKRAKFLTAIGKSDVNLAGVNFDDEKLSVDGLHHFIPRKPTDKGLLFDDSIIETKFKKLKQPKFNLVTYIGCAKIVYLNYVVASTNNIQYSKNKNGAFCYLLAFARDFNDPTKNMFKFSKYGTEDLEPIEISDDLVKSPLPGDCEYITKLNELITELVQSHSEEKYQQLNHNVTYLILLMSRRLVKSKKEFANALLRDKTHLDYWELCPQPLDCRLPIISENRVEHLDQDIRGYSSSVVLMILHALKTCSGRNRRIFRATFAPYMENNGLGLPTLFFEVAALYKIEESKLWDLLNTRDNYESLISLADYCYSQYEGSKCVPPKTYQLLPYCRVFNSNYHCELSASRNFMMCYTLACLSDMKAGTTVKNSSWTKSSVSVVVKRRAEIFAEKLYEQIA